MNKTLKWILISLGILVGLLLIAMVVFHFVGFGRGNYGTLPYDLDRGGLYGRDLRTFGRMPMMGLMPLMGFGLLRGFFGLGILALAVIGVVLLIRNGKTHEAAKTASAQPAVVENPAAAAEPERTCKKCSKVLQSDWAVCPYCGKKQ